VHRNSFYGVDMKKINQRKQNPYTNTDSNKRYYTYDYYLRKNFGVKCAKIPLDAGFTCPNIDGKCGYGGCIYCSGRGSGDFAESSSMPLRDQFDITCAKLSSKWSTDHRIAYFQAHTNTYAPLDILKKKFEEALAFDGVVGINIATRADCIDQEIAEYLADLAKRTVLTVELGLQTVNDKVAEFINRGHTFDQFLEGYKLLREASEKINICVHLIFGLPGEDRGMMLNSVKEIAVLCPDQVKFHLLHVLKNTKLAELYESGEYIPLEKDEYVSIVAESIEYLPYDTVVCRVTGDGMAEELIAPEWSRKKVTVINDIDKLLFEKQTYQGRLFSNNL